MRKILILLTIFTITFCYSFSSETSSTAKEERVHYSITIDEILNKKVHVKVSFFPKNDTLYMDPGANQFTNRWANFVSDVRVYNKGGKKIKLKVLGDAKWKMNILKKEELTLEYTVNLTHDTHKWSSGLDGATFSTEKGIFCATRSLIILNGKERTNIDVDVNIPKSSKFTSSWKPKDNSQYSFKLKSIDELSQSMFFVGSQEEIVVSRNGFKLIFSLGGEEVIRRKDFYSKMALGILDYYESLMGGVPKLDSSVFAVFINPGSRADGEVIGNSICVLVKKNGNDMEDIISNFIFSHEFFHLWSGKSFAPIDDRTEWFKEGYANYYAIKALYNIGYLTEESFTNFLSDFFFNKYITDDGLGKISMIQGEEKHDHWGLIYAGGLFAGIVQDIDIRLNSNNTKSLDDVMKVLFTNYSGDDRGYSLEDLMEISSDIKGENQESFFKKYITGKKRVPIETYLSKIGLKSKVDGGKLIINREDNLSKFQIQLINAMFGKGY